MRKIKSSSTVHPIGVLISDVHYSLSTYKIADKAFRMAIDKAAELRVPLIDAGDLTNDKAILRAECVNTLIETMMYACGREVMVHALVGNHSLINEKGKEHALNFLHGYANVIDRPQYLFDNVFSIPYQSSADDFLKAIKGLPSRSIVIGHQGTVGGQLGDYVKDPSAFDPALVRDYKVFLGHYHTHYTLGTTVSIGNPYTLTFGEAKDPPKGFLVLYSDGSFERVLTNLRSHHVFDRTYDEVQNMALRGPGGAFFENMGAENSPKTGDLVWLKVTGSRSQLDTLKKSWVSTWIGTENFKLDKIYTDNDNVTEQAAENKTGPEIMDMVIDHTSDPEDHKAYLKQLWREVIE